MRNRAIVTGVIGCVVFGPSALAQVLPPPPPPPTREEYVPPPPRPAPQPAQPRQSRPQAPKFNVPDLPYVSIVRKGEDGKVIRIDENLDFIAMKHNPMIGPATVEKIRPIVLDWYAKTEALVIDNLDIAMEVDEGLFERLNFRNEQDVMLANEAFKALFVVGPVSTHVLKNGGFERVQFDFTQKILGEYKTAMNLELAEKLSAEFGDDRQAILQAGAGAMFSELCRDARECYRRLLLLTATHIDALLPLLEHDSAAHGKAKMLASGLKSAKDNATKLEIMRELMRALEFDDQQALLQGAIEKRGEPDLSALEDAAIKPDGAQPQEPGVG